MAEENLVFKNILDRLESNNLNQEDNQTNVNVEALQNSFTKPEFSVSDMSIEEDNVYNNLTNKIIKNNQNDIDYTKLDASIPVARKLKYASKQEPMILGSAYRLARAGIESFFSDETYTEAAKRIENERQKKIFEEFPEFQGKREDLTVLSGRMGVAIADPVTFLIPWTKIAKAGKIATVGTGAAFGAVDTAAREKSLYGDVELGNVALGTLLGGASAGIGEVIANRFRKLNKNQQILTIDKKGNQVLQPLTDTDAPFIGPLPKETTDLLEQVGLDSYEISLPFIQRFTDNINSLGVKYQERDSLRKLIKQIKEQAGNADNKTLKQLELPIGDKGKTQSLFNRLEEAKLAHKKIQEDIDNILLIEQPNNLGIIGAESFIKAYKAGLLKGEFGKQLTRAFVHEAVRPLFGATGGAAMYLAGSEGQSDRALMYSIGVGAVFGVMGKRIENAIPDKSIRKSFKKTADEVFVQNFRVVLGRFLSGSEAARGTTMIKPMREMYEDLYGNRGTAYSLGRPQKESIEELRNLSLEFYRRELFNITGQLDDETLFATGRLLQQHNMPSGSKYSFLKDGDLENIQAQKAFNLLLALRESSFLPYVKSAGLEFKDIDNYGLTQILDKEYINKVIGTDEALNILYNAYKIQDINRIKKLANEKGVSVSAFNKVKPSQGGPLTDKQLKNRAINHLNKSDTVRKNEMLKSIDVEEEILDFVDFNSNPVSMNRDSLMQSASFINKERVLTDPEARAFAKDLFIQDPEYTFLRLFDNTIPVVEFSRRFGAKGQGLKDVIKDVKKFYGQYGDVKTNKSLRVLINEDLENLRNTVNAYFGTYQADFISNDIFKSALLTLQTVLSTTKLGKVALPSLGDLLQTMQNSGFKASFNSLIRQYNEQGAKALKPSANLGQRTIREQTGKLLNEPILGRAWKDRKYNGSLEKELSDFGQQAENNYQKFLINFQRNFFEAVQLGRVTRFAREFAYDAGAFRAFDLGQLAKKNKLKPARQRELDQLGMKKDDAVYLSQFNSMDDAFADIRGKAIINRAGRKAANRDALIPTVGNRRLFSQSRNPWMKFAGSFLSWAQAKTTQTNGLLRRIEDGDGKLALMMLTTLPLYGTVRYLQTQLNPNREQREKFQNPLESKEKLLNFVGESALFSGQIVPFYVDKIYSNYKYNTNDAVETLYPAAGLVNDLISLPNVEGVGSGLVKLGETTIPFAKEITRRESVGNLILDRDQNLKEYIEDVEKDTQPRIPNVEGGPLDKENPVEDVKEVSADRVDPLTGEPYSFVGLTETEKQMRRFGLMDNRVQLNQGSNLDMNNSESVIKKSAIAIRPLSDGRTEYTYNDGSKEIFDFGIADEPPLKSVFILPEILTLGGVRIGTKLLDFVTQTGKQIRERASVPKILFHGSQQRGLTELVPAATRSPNNPSLQRAIYTNPDQKNVIKFTGAKGSVYTVDSSSVSKLSNLFNITKNRVLNADKPDKDFLKYLDNEIMQLTRKKQRSPLAKQGEIREAKQLKDFKKDMLDKDNYITGITPAVRRALDKYNVDIVKTTPNFKNPDKVPNYIFLRDSIPIKDELLTILKDGKTYIKTN